MRGGGEDSAWVNFDFFMPRFFSFKFPLSCLGRTCGVAVVSLRCPCWRGRREWGGYKDMSPPNRVCLIKVYTANEGHTPGTFAPLPLGNMKPAIYSFQWLMLFHPQRRRPVITCHTSNSSPALPRAVLKPPPALLLEDRPSGKNTPRLLCAISSCWQGYT